MPRKSNDQRSRGQIVAKGDRKWLIRVYVGRDADNKRKYSSKVVTGTISQAQQARTQMLREIDTDTFVEPSKLTVTDFLNQWLETKRLASVNSAKEGISTRTHIDYRQKLSYVFKKLGHKRLDKVSTLDIQALYNELTQSGLSASTVRGVHRVLKQAFARAEHWRLIVRNPTDHVERAKVVREEMQVHSEEQVGLFLETAKDSPDFALWSLAYSTGMRPQELFALKWNDVQVSTTRIKQDGKFVERTGTVLRLQRALKHVGEGRYMVLEMKTNRSRRSIPIPDDTARLLNTHRRAQAEQMLAAGPKCARNDFVFSNAVGSFLDLTKTRKAFHAQCRAAKVPEIRLYDIRHTHATLLLAAGVNLKVVSERLGHASIALTADTYSHVLAGMQQEASDVVGAILYQVARVG